jgi:tetratricopeptide (TPR) repeat protein
MHALRRLTSCSVQALLAASVASLVAVPLLTGCSKNPDVAKREYVKSGDASMAKADYKTAVIQYRLAAQVDPQFGDAHYKLGQAYERLGDLPNAYKEFVRAADLLPQDAAVQKRAANYLLGAGQFSDAKTRAEHVLHDHPNDAEAQILVGNALAGLQDFDAAIQRLQDAERSDTVSPSAALSLGVVQQHRGDPAQAEEAFRKAVSIAPNAALPHLALANLYWSTGRPKDAEQELRTAIEREPKNRLANRAMMFVLITTGRGDAAEPYARTLAEATGNASSTAYAMAEYYLAVNQLTKAEPLLTQVAQGTSPEATAAKVRLAQVFMITRRTGDALRLVQEVLTAKPANAPARILKAQILLSDRQYAEAEAQLKTVLAADPHSVPATYWLAEAARAQGNLSDAARLLNETLQLQPSNAGVQLELAEIDLQTGHPDGAATVSYAVLKDRPTNLQATLLLAKALVAQGDVDGAEKHLRDAVSAGLTSPAILTTLGDIQRRKGNRSEAVRFYDQALTLNSAAIDPIRGLIAIDLETGHTDAALHRVDDVLAKWPKDGAALVLAATVYNATKRPDAAEHALKEAITVDPDSATAYAMLTALYVQQNRLTEALTDLDVAAGRAPQSAAGIDTMAGMVLEMQHRNQEAIGRYEKVLALNPRAAVAANNLAWLYAEGNGKLDVALQLSRTAKEILPNDPAVNDTLGWIYYKMQIYNLAIQAFEESARTDPKNYLFQYHLGLAYAKTGDNEKARKNLEMALKLNPNAAESSDARQVLKSLNPSS